MKRISFVLLLLVMTVGLCQSQQRVPILNSPPPSAIPWVEVHSLTVADMNGDCATSYTSGVWVQRTIPLGAYANQSAAIRWVFDTRDHRYNRFEGWYVDNIRIGPLKDGSYYTNGADNAAEVSAIVAVNDHNVQPGWHPTNRRSYQGGMAWWYGNDATGTFESQPDPDPDPCREEAGTFNAGFFHSPVLKIGPNTVLTFQTYWQVESVDNDRYDIMTIELGIDPICATSNFIANGGFHFGTANWSQYQTPYVSLQQSAGTDPIGIFKINQKVSNMQFWQGCFPIVRGKYYRLKFDAWASRPLPIQTTLIRYCDGPVGFNMGLDKQVNLTNSLRNYSYSFMATDGGVTGRIRFLVFPWWVNNGDMYFFDNICFEGPSNSPFKGGTEENTTVPINFVLDQNFPNPFNPTTNISFSIPKDGMVSLKVFDLVGREVASLVNEIRAAGSYTETFDASALSSGTYFYRLESGNVTQVKKMAIMK